MLKSVQHNPGVFSVDPDKLKPLEKWIMKIEGQILDGLIFDVCIVYNHQDFISIHKSFKLIMMTMYFVELCETNL
jgi:hypothetical protein